MIEEVKKKPKNSSLIIFTCFIKTCLQTKNYAEAILTYDCLKSFKIEPDKIIFNTILKGLVINKAYDYIPKIIYDSLENSKNYCNSDIYIDAVNSLDANLSKTKISQNEFEALLNKFTEKKIRIQLNSLKNKEVTNHLAHNNKIANMPMINAKRENTLYSDFFGEIDSSNINSSNAYPNFKYVNNKFHKNKKNSIYNNGNNYYNRDNANNNQQIEAEEVYADNFDFLIKGYKNKNKNKYDFYQNNSQKNSSDKKNFNKDNANTVNSKYQRNPEYSDSKQAYPITTPNKNTNNHDFNSGNKETFAEKLEKAFSGPSANKDNSQSKIHQQYLNSSTTNSNGKNYYYNLADCNASYSNLFSNVAEADDITQNSWINYSNYFHNNQNMTNMLNNSNYVNNCVNPMNLVVNNNNIHNNQQYPNANFEKMSNSNTCMNANKNKDGNNYSNNNNCNTNALGYPEGNNKLQQRSSFYKNYANFNHNNNYNFNPNFANPSFTNNTPKKSSGKEMSHNLPDKLILPADANDLNYNGGNNFSNKENMMFQKACNGYNTNAKTKFYNFENSGNLVEPKGNYYQGFNNKKGFLNENNNQQTFNNKARVNYGNDENTFYNNKGDSNIPSYVNRKKFITNNKGGFINNQYLNAEQVGNQPRKANRF